MWDGSALQERTRNILSVLSSLIIRLLLFFPYKMHHFFIFIFLNRRLLRRVDLIDAEQERNRKGRGGRDGGEDKATENQIDVREMTDCRSSRRMVKGSSGRGKQE